MEAKQAMIYLSEKVNHQRKISKDFEEDLEIFYKRRYGNIFSLGSWLKQATKSVSISRERRA